MRIKIFTTGGTIDKVYFDAKSEYEVGTPNIEKIFHELAVGFEYDIEPLFRKDSLDITDEDRQLIRSKIINSSDQKIVITHGTDTMTKSASLLKDITDKVIVFTGAMEPAMFKTSDAVFNIGCAVATAQSAKNGVYITMNGRVFNAFKVRKNVEAGRFEDIDS